MVWESEPRTGVRIKGSCVLDIATMQLIFACVCHLEFVTESSHVEFYAEVAGVASAKEKF